MLRPSNASGVFLFGLYYAKEGLFDKSTKIRREREVEREREKKERGKGEYSAMRFQISFRDGWESSLRRRDDNLLLSE